MVELTEAQVAGVAPDEKSIKAGKKLATPSSWQMLGRSDRALWGECKGSKLYQTRVDLSDLAAKCSCPSRKFPCKHALGLLFFAADNDVARGHEPEWVAGWLDERAGKRVAREQRAASPVSPADPAAQRKRAAKRHELVLEGLARMDLWLEDVVRQGLARLEATGYASFDEQARRLVDAQAPGLASRVRAIGEWVGVERDWPARVLDELGLLALASHAYRRIDRLEADHPGRAEDLRAFIGYTKTREEVLAEGERLPDRWLIVGQRTLDAETMRVQRTWLVGERSGRHGLVVQFAAGARPFGELLAPGTGFEGELAFHPSAHPQRAIVVGRADPSSLTVLPHACTVAAALERAAVAWSENPWMDRVLLVLREMIVVDVEGMFVRRVADPTGDALPIDGRASAMLLAASGGRPVDLVGEWDGRELFLLAAVGPDGYVAFTEQGAAWTS